jgi:hypothetical protein
VCSNEGSALRFFLGKRGISTGLVSKSSHPAAITFSLSLLIAFAVRAIIGIRLVAGSVLGCLLAVVGESEVHENEVRLFGARHSNALRPVGCNYDGEPRPRVHVSAIGGSPLWAPAHVPGG